MGAAPTCPPTPACCMPVPRVSSSSLQVTCLLLVSIVHSGWKLLVSHLGLAVCWHSKASRCRLGMALAAVPAGRQHSLELAWHCYMQPSADHCATIPRGCVPPGDPSSALCMTFSAGVRCQLGHRSPAVHAPAVLHAALG